MTEASRYACFVSYSHADEKTARWLQRRIEAYRVPKALVGQVGRFGPVRSRVGKLFRDRDEFAAGGELKTEIEAALSKSDALIVLCSPASSRSKYVEAEVETFQKSSSRIFPVILDGEPPGCFPNVLRSNPEFLAADLRQGKDGREGGLLMLLAGILGVGRDDLIVRERAAQRRRTAFAYAVAGTTATFAVAAAIAGWMAIQNAERRDRMYRTSLDVMQNLTDTLQEANWVGLPIDIKQRILGEARAGFDDMLSQSPNDPLLRRRYAKLLAGVALDLQNQGDAQSAAEAKGRLRELLDWQSRDPVDIVNRVHFAQLGGTDEKELDLLKGQITQMAECAYAETVLTTPPSDVCSGELPFAWSALSMKMQLAGRLPDAISAAGSAVDSHSKLEKAYPKSVYTTQIAARLLTNQARMLLSSNKLDIADAKLGEAAQRLKQVTEGSSTQLLSIAEDRWEMNTLRGLVQLRRRDIGSAKSYFQAAFNDASALARSDQANILHSTRLLESMSLGGQVTAMGGDPARALAVANLVANTIESYITNDRLRIMARSASSLADNFGAVESCYRASGDNDALLTAISARVSAFDAILKSESPLLQEPFVWWEQRVMAHTDYIAALLAAQKEVAALEALNTAIPIAQRFSDLRPVQARRLGLLFAQRAGLLAARGETAAQRDDTKLALAAFRLALASGYSDAAGAIKDLESDLTELQAN